MKKFIVDRIEGKKAVLECEDGSFVSFDLKSLPRNISDGDVLYFENGSCYLNTQETMDRQNKIKKLMDDLFE